MPFSHKQPYGVVYGHPWAKYEQNGTLYDAQGKNADDAEEQVAEPQSEEPAGRDFVLESAKEFLKNILSGGPLTRQAVFREAANNNQPWPKVEEAFTQLKGERLKSGNWIQWKLPSE